MVKSLPSRVYAALLLILTLGQAFAQVPGKIPYQAVARDASGNLLVNQVVGLRFSLCPDEPHPTIIHYQETHTVTTSDLGQINLSIGTGNVVIGSFNAIPWSDPGISLRVEMDPTGGTSYTVSGTTLLGSVPFALNAGSITGEGITTGTVSDSRLSTNVALYNRLGNFTALQNFEGSANVTGGMIIRKGPQTASFLTEWLDETGNTLASLTGDGSFGSKGVFSKFSQITADLTSFSPFTITGAAGQYANLTEWKNSSGAILASIGFNGVFSGSGAGLTDVTVAGEGITSGTISDNRLSPNVALYDNVGNFTTLQNFEGSANVTGGMIIRKGPQTASFLTEWQDETGNTLASLTGDGSFGSKGVFSKFSQITADPNASYSPFTVTGAAGQSASLTEWKNSSGTVLASVNSNGVFSGSGAGLTNVTVAGAGITSGTIDDARLSTNVALYNRSGNFTKMQFFDGSADGTAGIVIRKGTGQVVALTDWQDETGNTIAYMQPNGSINTRGMFSKSAQINADLNAAFSPFTVTGATGQAVNLTEWKNPSGTILASVSFSGVFSGNGSGLTNVVASGNTTITGDLTGTLSNAQIAANAVGSAEIVNESITAGDLAANSVATSEILDGTIESADLANSAVTTAKLQDNSVTGAKIAIGSDALGDILYYNGTDYARLPAGTAGQLLRMNGGVPTWSNPTGMIADMSSVTGQATLPTSTLAFISPQITVTIANTSQKIMVDVNCPLGTGASAASGLNIYPAYISTASGSSILTGGAGIFSLTCPASSMQIYSVNHVFTGLSAGTYRFGMAGNTANSNWTNRDYCYVRTVVVN